MVGGPRLAPADLRGWLRRAEWSRLRSYFEQVAPERADEFEARALATMALNRGPEGARRAAGDLRRACLLDRGNVLLAANLMQALIDAGEVDEALRLTVDAMRQAPHQLALADKHARALLAAGRWGDAQQAVAHAIALARSAGEAPPAGLPEWQAELAIGWWRPLAMGGVTLRLPAAADAGFVARCLRTKDFVDRYRRHQRGDEVAVASFVERARHRPLETRRIDWIIWRDGQPRGLVTLADLELEHRRGEFLIGLLAPDARVPTGLQASLAAMKFGFERLGLRKLVSHVYGDNPAAQANARHLGMRPEGVLREHLRSGAGALDLFVNGMLADEWRGDARLQRLVARWQRVVAAEPGVGDGGSQSS